jgi:probable rRNA maturation factor
VSGQKGTLTLGNRQCTRRVDLRLLRRIVQHLLSSLPPSRGFDLGICIVGQEEMNRLNETFLRHGGSTDVITFDYTGAAQSGPVQGELFVCLDEALLQARRFRVTWQAELTRYVIHGLLHLCGYDDQQPRALRRMKTVENRLLRRVARQFPLSDLGRE